jgi:hypothetical protein
VVSLYHEFNDPSTGKDTRDRIYSIFKSFDWLPTTDSLKQGGLATALGRLGTTTEQAVSEWLDEIKELDSINISRNLLTPGYISAALLSIRYYGVAGVEFLAEVRKATRYQDQQNDGRSRVSDGQIPGSQSEQEAR